MTTKTPRTTTTLRGIAARIAQETRAARRGRKLTTAGERGRIPDSAKPPRANVSPRQEKQPDTETYSGRIAVRVRKLRTDAKLSREDFQSRLAQHGLEISLPTIYAWENGNKGINPDHYPAIAKALGKSVRSLMPDE